VLAAVVIPRPVRRSGVDVFQDAAVRLFLAAVGSVAASPLAVERGKSRVLRVAAPATDGGWSMVYPSATGTIGRAHADQPDGEDLSGRGSDQGRSFSGGVLIGYARCSTDKQDLSAQRVTLRQLGVSEDRVCLDHGLTGRNRNRPGLQQALAAVREGDTLVVPKLDRLARSVPDARAISDSLAARGVRLSVAGTVYDPHDPMGKMFFNILASPEALRGRRAHDRRSRRAVLRQPRHRLPRSATSTSRSHLTTRRHGVRRRCGHVRSVRCAMECATGSAREVRSSARRDDVLVLAVAEKQVCRNAADRRAPNSACQERAAA
jgi:hypothetical protein